MEKNYGYKAWWYRDGELHRLDGPAIEWANGDKLWFQFGKLHKIDGPAIEKGGYKAWWVNGKELSEKEFLKRYKKKGRSKMSHKRGHPTHS